MKLQHTSLRNYLYIDIETVPLVSNFDLLSESYQNLWMAKHANFKTSVEENFETSFIERAGIFAEFGKVICISIGYFKYDKESAKDKFRVKSFSGDEEEKILAEFILLMDSHFGEEKNFSFCGHNIREFDIPFLCRRILINRLKLPDMLDVSGKKPWELNNLDTLHLWRFGDYKNYTSLKLIAEVMGLPSPKVDMEGKDVCKEYYLKKNLAGIVEYCQRDVVTVARLLMRFKAEKESLLDDDIIFVK